MALAARIFEPDPKGNFRHMIHDEVDKWVDQIIDEVFENGKEPTVMELSQLFAETKQKFFGCLFSGPDRAKVRRVIGARVCPLSAMR